MIIKSYIAEKNLDQIDRFNSVLFYGENQGLKKDFKEKLRSIHKEHEILNLFQDEIIKNKSLLVNEINNKSLFNKKKIIFIDQASEKIFSIVEEICKDLDDNKIFVFCGILDKKSKLRNTFEKDVNSAIIACYQDNDLTIRNLISKELSKLEGLSNQAINLIATNVNLDRDKLTNELSKIRSYFEGKKINLNDLESLLNIKTNDNFNSLKDEALKGNKIKTNELLTDTIFDDNNNILYLSILSQRLLKLKEINNLLKDNNNIETIITKLKPPVFWKDKANLIEQSKKWTKIKLDSAIEKMIEAEKQLKSSSVNKKELIIKNLMINLCLEANSS